MNDIDPTTPPRRNRPAPAGERSYVRTLPAPAVYGTRRTTTLKRVILAAATALALLAALGAAVDPPTTSAAGAPPDRLADGRVSRPRAVRSGDRILFRVHVVNAGTIPLGPLDVTLGKRSVATGGNLPGFPAVDSVHLDGLAPGEAVIVALNPHLTCGETFDGKVAIGDDGPFAFTFPDLLSAEEPFARRGIAVDRNNERYVHFTAPACRPAGTASS